MRFETGHRYRVSYTYECAFDDEYAWLIAYDVGGQQTVVKEMNLKTARRPAVFSYEFVAEEPGDYWVGLKKLTPEDSRDQADFILDDFSVDDLGQE